MNTIIADDSGDFDTDSLDNGVTESDEIDEVPESPISNVDEPMDHDRTDSFTWKSRENCYSKNNSTKNLFAAKQNLHNKFPLINLIENKCFDSDEKVLDYRRDIEKVNAKQIDFKNMKMKDLKEAKKMFDLEKNSRKKFKTQSEDRNVQSSFIKEKMKNTKKTINMISGYISKLESFKRTKNDEKFIKNRKSIFNKKPDAIVNETLTAAESSPEDSLDLSDNEIPDSLEGSDIECDELELETDQDNFISKKMTISTKDAQFVVVEQSLEKDNFDSDSLESNINSSLYQSLESKNEVKETSIEKSSIDETDEDIELQVYKNKTLNSNFNHKFENNGFDKCQSSPSKPKMIGSPARKRSERRKLFGFMCKVFFSFN